HAQGVLTYRGPAFLRSSGAAAEPLMLSMPMPRYLICRTGRFPMMRLLRVLMLLVTVAGLAGCEALGLAADTIAPPKTKAIYNLQGRLTLVLVDDPNNQLGNDALTDQIAAMIEFELKQNEVVSRFVPLQ